MGPAKGIKLDLNWMSREDLPCGKTSLGSDEAKGGLHPLVNQGCFLKPIVSHEYLLNTSF